MLCDVIVRKFEDIAREAMSACLTTRRGHEERLPGPALPHLGNGGRVSKRELGECLFHLPPQVYPHTPPRFYEPQY